MWSKNEICGRAEMEFQNWDNHHEIKILTRLEVTKLTLTDNFWIFFGKKISCTNNLAPKNKTFEI